MDVQRIQNLYWNLIARQDQVRVAEKSLETATALLNQTRTQHEVGVVSRVEVVEA
jgi:outer membrane protein TolC